MKLFYYPLTIGLVCLSVPLWAQCERQDVVNDYNINYLTSSFNVNDMNWNGNFNTCNPGTISSSVQNKILKRINYYRRLVGVEDKVVFSTALNQKSQKAALMQEANNSLSHCTGPNGAPCNTWQCSNADAIQASQSSNLAWGNWNYFNPIDLYIEDGGQYNEAVGHRRWIFYSKAKTFGNGITPNREVLWVFGNSGNPSIYNQFIAYPPAGYIPAPLVYDRWSFGIPGADFTSANVDMQDEAGNPISLTVIHRAKTGYGDRTIVWEPDNIVTTSNYDINYTVTVSNIQNAPQSSYTYTVTIIQPTHPPACPNGEAWSETACACGGDEEELMLSGIISSGTYTSSSSIEADGMILGGATVVFEAGESITLSEGFTASPGSTFAAVIMDGGSAAPTTVEARQSVQFGEDIILNEPPLEENSVAQVMDLPLRLSLAPNPASEQVNVQIYLPTETALTMELYDITGKQVRILARNELYGAGTQQYELSVGDLLPGTYYLRVVTETTQSTEKLMIVK